MQITKESTYRSGRQTLGILVCHSLSYSIEWGLSLNVLRMWFMIKPMLPWYAMWFCYGGVTEPSYLYFHLSCIMSSSHDFTLLRAKNRFTGVTLSVTALAYMWDQERVASVTEAHWHSCGLPVTLSSLVNAVQPLICMDLVNSEWLCESHAYNNQ